MKIITVDYVCKAHMQIIELTGGRQGILNMGLLESSVNGIYQTFDSVELYPTLEDKAAFLCFSLIKNHAFEDGNKRIGINILQTFLQYNNYLLKVTDEELIDLGIGVAESRYNVQQIKNWIIEHKAEKEHF